MAEEKKRRRRKRPERQQWNPHWLLKLAYTALTAAWSGIKIAVGAAATVVLILLICATVFVGTLGDYLNDDILTEAAQWSLDDFMMEETSFIYYVDRNGDIQQLQQIYTTTDRQRASLDEIPQAMVDAVVAIEDKRFYEHQGVDWITTVKACLNMFFGGDDQFGGSTITQQLVKNTSGEKSVTVQRKVMEIFRAQIAERSYDKDVIMEQYLNRIYLGRGCYGVKSAAAEYFGKELQTLTPAECAALISITNNPSMFNPYSDSVYMYKGEERDGAGRNRYRQLNVLDQMLEQGYLTKEEHEEAVSQEMVFKSGIADEDRWTVCENPACGYQNTRSHFNGDGSSYYCPECGGFTPVTTSASQHIYSWYVDAVILDFAAYLAEGDGRNWDEMGEADRELYLERIQKGGYHIYTTLDMDVQRQVDEIYQDISNMPKTNSQQQLQSAIVVIDNRSGDVVALSGGVGEKTTFLGYNRATQAKLQTGSSQKPISVYAPAFESGKVTPATVFKDLPYMYTDSGPWPKNDSRTYAYSKTVYQGIVSSINSISVQTLDAIGPDYGYSFAKYNFGLHNLVENYEAADGTIKSDIGLAPLGLGALTRGVTVREMSAAYATFANHGTYREPRLYTKVYNSDGVLVVDNTQDSKDILSEKTVNYMNYCLYNAVKSGTGRAARINGQYVAGKTGTTSSNRDRWFCGYTTHYTAAVWVGYDQPEQIRVNVNNPAATMWKKVMEPIHADLPGEGLFDGSVFHNISVCLDSGKLATSACGNDARGVNRVVSVSVYAGDGPTETCDKHISVEYCVDGGGVANDYCHRFGATVQTRSLVKMTPEEIQEIEDASYVGLEGAYADHGAFYYLGEGDIFEDDIVENSHMSYCRVHNADTWAEYEEDSRGEENMWDDSPDYDSDYDSDEDWE